MLCNNIYSSVIVVVCLVNSGSWLCLSSSPPSLASLGNPESHLHEVKFFLLLSCVCCGLLFVSISLITESGSLEYELSPCRLLFKEEDLEFVGRSCSGLFLSLIHI